MSPMLTVERARLGIGGAADASTACPAGWPGESRPVEI